MNVNVTYIEHSGFLLEWEEAYWLFDYYKGDLPDFDGKKRLLVFVSHRHDDHFNPEIFNLYKKHSNIRYFISSDIKLDDNNMSKYGITKELASLIQIVKPNQEYLPNNTDDIVINTLKSTDIGVAFLIKYKGKTIYHAGDLNLWVWKGEDKQFNNNMRAIFIKEIDKLNNVNIDLAFAPLDPRQEEWYGLGIDELLSRAKINYLFPMHFWQQPKIIKKFKKEREDKQLTAKIIDLEHKGQIFNIDI